MRRRAASAASTIRTRDAASCSRASAFASAAVTSSAKLPTRSSVSGRERVRQRAGHHDRAPEAPGDLDRRSDDRPEPELAQLRGELALDAGVVVHALGTPASVDLRGHRLALDRDVLADRKRRPAARRPGADDRREALVVVADHVGALHREQPAELLADPVEEGRRGRVADDHGRDSAQRCLLGKERPEPGGVVVAAHRKAGDYPRRMARPKKRWADLTSAAAARDRGGRRACRTPSSPRR